MDKLPAEYEDLYMIEIGTVQKLIVVKYITSGAYLGETLESEDDIVLLPRKEVPSESEVGTELEVFIYKDSEDRITATLKRPELMLGEIGRLEVIDVTKIGAFMSWGLSKDLLLPYGQQLHDVKKGKKYLVAVYEDKSGRLCATMKFKNRFSKDVPYQLGEIVQCQVYDESDDLGAFVIVDKKYEGLIAKNVMAGKMKYGDTVEARVQRVRPDGRIDLSQLESVKKRMDSDSDILWEALNDAAGRLPFNDKSDPDIIKEEFGMSKRAFKRAVGQLLKKGKIVITEDGIEMK